MKWLLIKIENFIYLMFIINIYKESYNNYYNYIYYNK